MHLKCTVNCGKEFERNIRNIAAEESLSKYLNEKYKVFMFTV